MLARAVVPKTDRDARLSYRGHAARRGFRELLAPLRGELGQVAVLVGRAGDAPPSRTSLGGAGKLSTFVTLLGSNKLDVAVVVDSITKDTGAVRRPRESGPLAANGLIEISEFTKDADIEDRFDRDFYLQLVSKAHARELPAPVTIADINAAEPLHRAQLRDLRDRRPVCRQNARAPARDDKSVSGS